MINRALYKGVAFIALSMTVCSAKATHKAELIINIRDCRGAKDFVYLDDLTILMDGKEFKRIRPDHKPKQKLSQLEKATYTVSYLSIFGLKESVSIVVTEYKKYSVEICINFLDHSKVGFIPTIDQLKENEHYEILFSSQGCFHFRQDSVDIQRQEDCYIIAWKHKTKRLTKADLDLIRQFEIELNFMTDFGCTTLDTYVIKYKNVKKEIKDGTCNWNGGHYLLKRLFEEN